MPTFLYTAFTSEGRQIKGRLEAADILEARRNLKAQRLAIADLTDGGAISPMKVSRSARLFGKGFNRTRFFANLSVLLNAGLPFDQAIQAIRDVATGSMERPPLDAVVEAISAGGSPSAALAKLQVLDEDILALIASGERSGRLAQVVSVVATDLEQSDLHRKRLLDAAAYPLFLLLMMCGALSVVTFVLVPTLEPIFESSGRDAPVIISVLSAIRTALETPVSILGIIGLMLAALALGLARPAVFKAALKSILLKLPLLGVAVRNLTLSRYLQILALLVGNAVTLPEALSLAAKSCSTSVLREKMLHIRDAVVSGKRLSHAFREANIFPVSVVSLVSIGDEVNQLSVVLQSAGDVLRSDSQRTLDRVMAMLTPAITIFLGALIGGLVISVMSALLSINELSMQ